MNTSSNQEYIGSITWLNKCGDIVIAWDDKNHDKILDLIKKKLAEGYSFFTTSKFDYKTLEYKTYKRKQRVTGDNLEDIGNVIINDDVFDRMVDGMDDEDIASVIVDNSAKVIKRQGKSELTAMKKLDDPKEIAKSNSVALRPILGG